jgi:glycosyltransferase involved in cell wall biosynthesis
MITILMAVYNGEKYLSDQIESILAQTVKEWKLVIQDDCSTDATPVIAMNYAEKYPNKIFFLRRSTPSGSAKSNFFSMIKYADTEYMMTCDQDDIWLPHKIEITLNKFTEIEEKVGSNIPILIHTDLKVVDKDLNILSESLFRYQNLNRNNDKLNSLLVQNIVTGCTLMVNRALVNRVQTEPDNAIMHDWWFALTAAAFGYIVFVDEPTVLYRQHSSNEVGAKKVNSLSYIVRKAASIIKSPKNIKHAISATYAQAHSFFDTFRDDLPDEALQILSVYMSIAKVNIFTRINIICRYNFWKTGLIRKIGQIIFA